MTHPHSAPFRLLVAALVSALVSGAPSAGAEIVVVSYLANEGFHLRSGETGVLVDALFGDGIPGYPAVSADARRSLEAASPPFDEVDLVLATHEHPDHFDADAVLRFLSANRRAVFVSTPQAVARFGRLSADLDQRVRAVLPEPGIPEHLDVGEIRLRVFNLHHGDGTTAENLGFEIGIADRKVLHVGDTEVTAAEIAALRLDRAEIDLALLPPWILHQHTLVLEGIRARQVGLMHVPAPGAPRSWFGAPGSAEGLVSELRETYPGLVTFLDPGDILELGRDQP